MYFLVITYYFIVICTFVSYFALRISIERDLYDMWTNSLTLHSPLSWSSEICKPNLLHSFYVAPIHSALSYNFFFPTRYHIWFSYWRVRKQPFKLEQKSICSLSLHPLQFPNLLRGDKNLACIEILSVLCCCLVLGTIGIIPKSLRGHRVVK